MLTMEQQGSSTVSSFLTPISSSALLELSFRELLFVHEVVAGSKRYTKLRLIFTLRGSKDGNWWEDAIPLFISGNSHSNGLEDDYSLLLLKP